MVNKKYKNDDLEILIATMNRADLSFLEIIFQKPLEEIREHVVVINQTEFNHITSNLNNIKVFNVNEFGLSKSRNLALEYSSRDILWILDDDCKLFVDSIEKIIAAHNEVSNSIITFQTKVLHTDAPYHNYLPSKKVHTDGSLRYVLSPEITFKRNDIILKGLYFDERFGLGAQFQDSENFIFLKNAIAKGFSPYFYDKCIVMHPEVNSSQEYFHDRIIYARGALAAFEGKNVTFKKWKYGFFLVRKRAVGKISEFTRKIKVFQSGVTDFYQSSN